MMYKLVCMLLAIACIFAVSAQIEDVVQHRSLLSGKHIIQIGSIQCNIHKNSNARGDDESDFLKVDQVESVADCCNILTNNPDYNVFVYCPRINNCFNLLNPSDEITYQSCYLKYQNAVAQGNLPQVYTEGPGVDFISGHIPFKSRVIIGDKSEANALLVFKNSVRDNSGLSSWSGTDACNNWLGITCTNGRVTNISVGGVTVFVRGLISDIQTSIPHEWSVFDKLKIMKMGQLRLTGTLPVQLSLLKELEVFDINDGTVRGTLPIELSTLSKIQEFDVRDNRMTGSLPPQYSTFVSLRNFLFNANKLTGKLPFQYSTLTSLSFVQGFGNSLTGTLPLQFSVLVKLQFLLIPGNSFTGTLPIQYSTLGSLQSLAVGANSFTGTLPPQYSALVSLRLLQTFRNSFITGTLPPQYSTLVQISNFNCQQNDLSGTLPVEYSELVNCQLFLDENRLTGTVPAQYTLLARLQLSQNNLCAVDPSIFEPLLPSAASLEKCN